MGWSLPEPFPKPGRSGRRGIALILWVGLAGALALPTATLARPVDLELILAVDTSSSVNYEEYALQMAGYAQAFRNPALLDAVHGAGLSIADVVVSGRVETSRRALARALAAPQGGSIIAFDSQAAQRRIEALGWVRRASVARHLPDTIAVTIVERRPFAIWRRGKRRSLIDREGAVIGDRIAKRYAGLLVVTGRQAPAQVGALVDMLARQPALYARVKAARRQGGRRWDVRFANGLTVRLPEDDGAEAWARLAALEQKHSILSRQLRAIDLRLPDRLIVRLTPEAASQRRHPGKST